MLWRGRNWTIHPGRRSLSLKLMGRAWIDNRGGADARKDAPAPFATRPLVVATDLDGTLMPAGGHLSDRSRRALEAVRQVGVETVFVTGRPPRWVDHMVEDIDGHGIVICGNGAFVYEVASRRMIASHGLEPEMVRGFAADIRAAMPGVAFAAEMVGRFLVESPYLSLRPRRYTETAEVGPVEGVSQPVGKLLVLVPPTAGMGWAEPRYVQGLVDPIQAAETVAVVRDAVGEHGEVVTSGMAGLIEIGPAGVTKASALAEFCAKRGVGPERVWTFGDQHNDLAMLRWSARSFAAGDADPEVVAVATDRCPGPEEDGVAQVLEWLARS